LSNGQFKARLVIGAGGIFVPWPLRGPTLGMKSALLSKRLIRDVRKPAAIMSIRAEILIFIFVRT